MRKASCRSGVSAVIRNLSVLFLVFALIYQSVPAGADEVDKDTLKLLLWQGPTTLNPHFAQGAKDQTASRIIYEPLASFDRDGNLVPFLAAEIPSLANGGVAPDGKSVTWKLKQGVVWSDGVPFTAKDVTFTYHYITNPAVGSVNAAVYKPVETVEAIDDHTVKVTFKDVTPGWALPFVGVKGMIIPEHVFAPFDNANAATAAPNLAPIGTGPYKLKEFRQEDVLLIGEDVVNTVKLIYEPNPLYRDAGRVHFKQVVLQGGGDATVAANAVLHDGVVDYAWNLQLDDETLTKLEAEGKGKVMIIPGAYVERIVFNFTDPNHETDAGERSSTQFPHPILCNLHVRQAMALAVDRDRIAALYGRTGHATANLLIAPSIYDSPNTRYSFDLKKAAAMLDAEGWKDSDGDGVRDKDGVPLSVLFQANINPVRKQILEIVKKDFESIGIRVETKLIDSSIYFGTGVDNTNNSDHFYADLEAFAWGNKAPDPGAYMRALTCSEAPQMANEWSGTNSGRYCNPDYDALYNKSTTEIDPARRRQLFISMNDLAIGDVAMIPLVASANVSAVKNDIDGFDASPWDVETWNIADWRRRSAGN
jgi:peptide/nickel transport system substrate-binding protein